MSKITEKTLIPLSLVITIIGFTIWLAALASDTKANTKDIDSVRSEQKSAYKEMIEYQKQTIQDLTEIKTKLNIKSK